MKWIRARFCRFWGHRQKRKNTSPYPLLLFKSVVYTRLRSVPSCSCEPAVLHGGFWRPCACVLLHYFLQDGFHGVRNKPGLEKEVDLLLDFFVEETIQMDLEKAKCPNDKNAVYVEVQKKLEGSIFLRIFLLKRESLSS